MGCLALRGAQGERYRETETRAGAEFTLDADLARHQIEQLAAQVQAESGAFVQASRCAVELGEALEQQPHLLGTNADAGVDHTGVEPAVARRGFDTHRAA